MYSSIRGNFAESEGLDIGDSILDSAAKDLTKNRNKVQDKSAEALKKEREALEKENEKKRKKKEKQKNPWNKVMSRWAVLGPQKVSTVDAEKGKAFNRSEKGDLQYAFLYENTKKIDTASQAAAASAAAKARLKFEKEVSKSRRRRRRRKSDNDPELLRLKMEEENAKLVSKKAAGPATGRGGIKFLGEDLDDDNNNDEQNSKQQATKRGVRKLQLASKALAMMAARADFNFQTRIQLFPHHRIDVFFDSNDTASATSQLRPVVSQWVLDIHRCLDRPFFLWLSDWKEAEGRLFCVDGRTNKDASPTQSNPASPTTIKRAASATEVTESAFMASSTDPDQLLNFQRSLSSDVVADNKTLSKKSQRLQREELLKQKEQERKERRARATEGFYTEDRLPIHHPDKENAENSIARLPKLEPNTENFLYPHEVATIDPRSPRDFATLRPSSEYFSDHHLQLGEQKTHLCTPTIQQIMQTTWLSSEVQKSQANQKLLDVIFSKHERTLGRVVTRCFFAALHGERSLILGLAQFKQFAKKARIGVVDIEPWKTYGITKEDDNLEELVKRATSGDSAAVREVRAAVAAAATRKKDQEDAKLARKRSLSKKDLLAKNQPDYVNDLNKQDKQGNNLNATIATSAQEEGNTGVLALLPILFHQLSKPYGGLSIASFALSLVFLSEMLYRPAEITKNEDDDEEDKNGDDTFLTTTNNKNNHTTTAAKTHTEQTPAAKKSSFLVSKTSSLTQAKENVADTPSNNNMKTRSKKSKSVTFAVSSSLVKQEDSSVSNEKGDHHQKTAQWFSLNNTSNSTNTENDLSIKSPTASPHDDQLSNLFSSHIIRREQSVDDEEHLLNESDDDEEEDEEEEEEQEKEPPLEYPEGTSDHEILCDTFVIFIKNHLLPFIDTCFPWYADPDISVVTTIPKVHNIVHREFRGMLKQMFALSSQAPTESKEKNRYQDLKRKAAQLKLRNLEKNNNNINKNDDASDTNTDRNSPGQSPLLSTQGSGDFSKSAGGGGNSPLEQNASTDSFSPPHQQQSNSASSPPRHSSHAVRVLSQNVFDEDILRQEDKPEEELPEVINNVMSGVVLARLLQSIAHFTHLSQKDEKIIDATEQLIWAVSLQHANHAGKTQMREHWAQGHSCSPIVLWENSAIRAANVDAGLISRSERNISLVDYFQNHQLEAKETKPAAIADYTEPIDSIVVCFDGFLEGLVRMAILSEIGRENSLRFPKLEQVEAAVIQFFRRKVYMACRDIFTGKLSPRDEMRAAPDYEKKEGTCVVRTVRLVSRSNLLKEGPCSVHFHQVDLDAALQCCFQRSFCVFVKTALLGERAGSFVLPPLKMVLRAIIRNVEAAVRSSHKHTPIVQPTPHVVNFRVTGRLISQSSLAIRINFVHIFEIAFGSFGRKWTAVPLHNVHETSETNPPFSVTTPTAMFHREETAVFLRARELILASPPDAARSILRFARSLVISARRCVSILLEASLFGDVTKENVKELMKQDEVGFALAQLLLGWNLCEARKDSPLLPGNEEEEDDDDSDEEDDDDDEDEEEDNDALNSYRFGRSSNALEEENFFASDEVPASSQSESMRKNSCSSSSRRKKASSNKNGIFSHNQDFNPTKSMIGRLRRHSLNAENFAAPKSKSKLITHTEALDMLVGGDAAKSMEWMQLMRKSKCQVHPLMHDDTEAWLDETSSIKLERAQSIEEFSAEVVQDLLYCDAAWVARHEHKVLKFMEQHRGDSRQKAFEQSLARHLNDRSGSIVDTFGSSSFLAGSMSRSGSFFSASGAASGGDNQQQQQQRQQSSSGFFSQEDSSTSEQQNVQFSEHLTHGALFTAPTRQMILFTTQILKSASSAYRVKRLTKSSALRSKFFGKSSGSDPQSPGSAEVPNLAASGASLLASSLVVMTPRPPSSPTTTKTRRTSVATPGFRVGNAASSPSCNPLNMLSPTRRRPSSSSSSPTNEQQQQHRNSSFSASSSAIMPDSPSKRSTSLDQVKKEIINQQSFGVRVKRTYFDRSLIFSMLSSAISTESPGWSFLLVSRGRVLASIGFGDEFGDVMFYRQEKDPSCFITEPKKTGVQKTLLNTTISQPTTTSTGLFGNSSSDVLANTTSNNKAAAAAIKKTVKFASSRYNQRRAVRSTSVASHSSSDADSASSNVINKGKGRTTTTSSRVNDDDYDNNNMDKHDDDNDDEDFDKNGKRLKPGHHLLTPHAPSTPSSFDNFVSLPRPVGFYSVHGKRLPFIWTRPFAPGGDVDVRHILDVAARRTSYSSSHSDITSNSSPVDRNAYLLGDLISRSTHDKKDLQLVGCSSFSNLVPFSRSSSLLRAANNGLASNALDHLGHPNTCRVYKIFLEDKLKSCFTPNFLFGVLVETQSSVGGKSFSGPFSTLAFQIPHFNASNFALTLYSNVPLNEVIGWYHEYVLNVAASDTAQSGNAVSITSDETMFGPFTVQDAYQPAVIACALHLFRENARESDASKLRSDLTKRGFVVTPQVV